MKVWNNYQTYIKQGEPSFYRVKIDKSLASKSECTMYLSYPNSKYGPSGNHIDFWYGYIIEENIKTYFADIGEYYQFKENVTLFATPSCPTTFEGVWFWSEEYTGSGGITPPSGNLNNAVIAVYSNHKCNEKKKEVSYDMGETWQDARERDYECEDTEDCSCGILSRWVEDGTICDYTNLCKRYKLQEKQDCTSSWTDKRPLLYKVGEIIELDSSECGTVDYKEEVDGFTCDEEYTKYERIRSYVKKKSETEWTEVCPDTPRKGKQLCRNSFYCGFKTGYTAYDKLDFECVDNKKYAMWYKRYYETTMTDDNQPFEFRLASETKSALDGQITSLNYSYVNKPTAKSCLTGQFDYEAKSEPVPQYLIDRANDVIGYPYSCECNTDWRYKGQITDIYVWGKDIDPNDENLTNIYIASNEANIYQRQAFRTVRMTVSGNPITDYVEQPPTLLESEDMRYFATGYTSVNADERYGVDIYNSKLRKGSTTNFSIKDNSTRVDNYKYAYTYSADKFLHSGTTYNGHIEILLDSTTFPSNYRYARVNEINECTGEETGRYNYVVIGYSGQTWHPIDEFQCGKNLGDGYEPYTQYQRREKWESYFDNEGEHPIRMIDDSDWHKYRESGSTYNSINLTSEEWRTDVCQTTFNADRTEARDYVFSWKDNGSPRMQIVKYIYYFCDSNKPIFDPELSVLEDVATGSTVMENCVYDPNTDGDTTLKKDTVATFYSELIRDYYYILCGGEFTVISTRYTYSSSTCGYREIWEKYDEGCAGSLVGAENEPIPYAYYEFQRHKWSKDFGTTYQYDNRVRYGAILEAQSIECGYVPTLEDWKLNCEGITEEDIVLVEKEYPEANITSTEGDWTYDAATNTYTSNKIGHSEETDFKIHFRTYAGTCQVNISISASTESGCDYGYVSNIDSENTWRVKQISGVQTSAVTMATDVVGDHFILFRYEKDYSVDKYQDNIKFQITFVGGGGKIEEISPEYQDCVMCEDYKGVPTLFAIEHKRLSYDMGQTWIDTDETRTERILKWKSSVCGYRGDLFEYRSTENCVNGKKIKTTDTWVSSDNGLTWSLIPNTTRTEEIGDC